MFHKFQLNTTAVMSHATTLGLYSKSKLGVQTKIPCTSGLSVPLVQMPTLWFGLYRVYLNWQWY